MGIVAVNLMNPSISFLMQYKILKWNWELTKDEK